ncbi:MULTISPECIES: 6-hydroxyaminopurine reductase [Rahnella]|jgi:MOSC domain-containing protein YiiM|uniref:6-N-hydroxylaminopurine resistance protein n=1 Tax=Rahnella contaminans TaxID=2703882 RepID=A0A6M2B879_9GAMM|nr:MULTISPECIES: 6-hydroxyaminopurine reductase [Rahnella]KAB8312038.1 6-N-hydroxylaminopurine resistance protein [Rouxiella chamberiensis]MBU9820783.1 6-N-hydroxylaminopurine resistance protein [Rahnella sp. BCC 1045]MCS3425775.1 MOSC domain-containing protein YiiM [Rahnella sp. BIGb0603]NGX88912.1 6-N-hydroxylaminopurine resistance protein [Rahnella contaminans]
MHYPDVYIGNIESYPDYSPSAIAKRQIDGAVVLTSAGLEGDQQAEKSYHGGADRALCHFPREHYAWLRQQFPEEEERFHPPAFGENLSTLGMTEDNVFIGDIFRWGEALIQVTQPRAPCYKLNHFLGCKNLSPLLQQSGRCGWLYRVVGTGNVSGDRPLELLTRNSEVSVAEAISIAFNMPFDEEQYRRLMSAAGISASWTKTMQMRLVNRKIEDFGRRLFGK